MNCKRAEELIPLYAGGDIERRAAAEVESHLTTCIGCAELAAEYEASLKWLSGASPELDQALLADVKRGVMRELQTANSRPGWFEAMSAALGRALSRPAVAAALLLIVFGVLTFWLYLAKPASPAPIELTEGGPEQTPSVPGGNQGPGLIKPHRKFAIGHHRRGGAHAHSYLGKRTGNGRRQTLTQVANTIPEAQPPSAFAVESAGTLRIDIQTGDPNIRIIWFAPREVDSQEANP
jgi:hypothetical protein